MYMYMYRKCSACSRKASTDKYCDYHAQSFESLKEHYNQWVKAYGTISWSDYLTKLANKNETGIWVKEVISIELKKL
jgi:hypothetical protein